MWKKRLVGSEGGSWGTREERTTLVQTSDGSGGGPGRGQGWRRGGWLERRMVDLGDGLDVGG